MTGQDNQGATYGGKKVTFTRLLPLPRRRRQGNRLGRTGTRRLASECIGSAAIAKPTINLNALGFGFNNQNDFLKLARIFEDIGVTAYGGAAPLISSKAILGTAGRILATEAEHVGNIRLQVAVLGVNTAPPLDCRDFLPPPLASAISVNNGGLTHVRTPGQVCSLRSAVRPL
jgi:hypothetical protein